MANINFQGESQKLLEGYISKSNQDSTINGGVSAENVRKSLITMAQSSYFTVQLSGIVDTAFKTEKFGSYLPVKSINATLENIEAMTIPVGIFGDLTLPHRKKIGRINIVINDKSDDFFEHALRKWYSHSTGEDSPYIGYLSQIIKVLTIKSYSPTGVLNNTLKYEVMLVDNINISRSYGDNALKEISFSLAVVGRAQ